LTLPARLTGLLIALSGLCAAAAPAVQVVHHSLQVDLAPDRGELHVHDVITLPAHSGALHFRLRKGLSVTSPDAGVRLTPEASDVPQGQDYRITLPGGRSTLTMDYGGKVDATTPGGVVAMGDQQESAGFIHAEGVYLDGDSLWYPRFGDELVSFTLAVTLPPGWAALSQGPYPLTRQDQTLWTEDHPQEEIYLLAAPYHVYHDSDGDLNTLVYLRSDDAALANQYLSAIGGYVNMYSRLLGLYPYGKFAVVENSWETGYGMPSFTLLGPQVMRLPFILYTSLPHEILHNWWGNGVYVDDRQGNWSEGLTAYLADHLLSEQAGKGAVYRRNALLRYTNYVSERADFPIKDFKSRHSEATQAVGYDKAMMVFHMLRRRLGDRTFVAALRRFYQNWRFRRADWDDLRQAFEAESHQPLHDYFRQWLTRTGAPMLQVREAHAVRTAEGYTLSATLAQVQPGAPFQLRVPLAVQLDGQDTAWETTVGLAQAQQTIRLKLPARPWRLAVDPQFDLFRRLDPGELPATLSEALGAARLLMVLPAAAPAALRDAYQQLAQGWAAGGASIEIRWDKDLERLPEHRAVWLLGWENRFLAEAAAPLDKQLSLSEQEARLDGNTLRRDQRAVVVAAHRDHNGPIIVWLGSDNPAALPGLARKLPHYGSYSYLAFEGDEPKNVLKGQWEVTDSPLQVTVTQEDNAKAPDIPFTFAPHQPLIAPPRN
jgi:hypothetical protein